MSDLTRSEIAASAFYVDPSNPRPRHRRPLTAEAFRDAGWIVTSLVRPGGAARAPTGTEIVEGDALDHQAVAAAARGVPIILHALNASYTKWYVSSYRYSRRPPS